MSFTNVDWHVVHYAGKANETVFGFIGGSRVFVIEKDTASLGYCCFVLEDRRERQIWNDGTLERAKAFCETWWLFRMQEQSKEARSPVGAKMTGIVVDEANDSLEVEEDDSVGRLDRVSHDVNLNIYSENTVGSTGNPVKAKFHFDVSPGKNTLTFNVNITADQVKDITINDLGRLFKLEKMSISGSDQVTLVFSPAAPEPASANIDGQVFEITQN